jgi:hypothetical protein
MERAAADVTADVTADVLSPICAADYGGTYVRPLCQANISGQLEAITSVFGLLTSLLNIATFNENLV